MKIEMQFTTEMGELFDVPELEISIRGNKELVEQIYKIIQKGIESEKLNLITL